VKPRHAIAVWSALALCAALVIGAMAWLSRGLWEAERDRLQAERQRGAAEARADLEERTRLALWRMDATGAAEILRENQLGPAIYQDNRPVEGCSVAILRFEIREGGAVTSPAGEGDARLTERMKQLRDLLAANPLPGDEWTQLNEAVIQGESQWQAVPKEALREQTSNSFQRQSLPADELRKQESYQVHSNISERAQRAKALDQSAGVFRDAAPPEAADLAQAPAKSRVEVAAGAPVFIPSPVVSPFRSVWLGGELFLLRRVSQGPSGSAQSPGGPTLTRRVQGVWLDSGKLRETLLAGIVDLLPNASLLAVAGERAAEDPLAMVSFPFQLERGESPLAAPVHSKGLFQQALWLAWAAVAMAVLTSTLLVRGIMRLSERRASFVSSVTHELRTPLTTFRLYSDMLESGAVKPEKRGDYLRVLSREADRLSHLVENVLAFSRIERGSARSTLRDIPIRGFLESLRERLETRLSSTGLTLEWMIPADTTLRTDASAIEHILFNLIDNAAKYAASGNPPIVRIEVAENGRWLEIRVSDHGPGIAAGEIGRIFQPFHKSASEAAESQPGVGLGLALSRRLARSLGGELICQPRNSGATFILRLPLRSGGN
jgi:signal transduction histidine kinase